MNPRGRLEPAGEPDASDAQFVFRPATELADMIRSVALLAATLAVAESALPLAFYIKTCSRNDPNLNECTLKHGKLAIPFLLKGDPKYATPVLNPMEILEIKLEDVEKENKSTGVDIIMRNLKIYGLDRFELKKARFDLDNKTMDIAGSSPHIALIFDYEIDGKILWQRIVGNGAGVINMTETDLSYTNDFDLVTRDDGLEYLSPGDHEFNYKAKNMIWHLDNLFNGDKRLEEYMNSFLNANWDVLNEEMGPYLSQAIGEVVKQIVTSAMKLVPYDVIFPESV